MAAGMTPVLDTRLSVQYRDGSVALSQAHITVGRGEIVGVVGESGAGKSTLAAALLRVERLRGARAAGTILLNGEDLLLLPEKRLRDIRGRVVSLIHQSAMSSLNPALTLERQLKEAWRAHSSRPWNDARAWVENLLASLGLDAPMDLLRRYPGEISGGQAQRILICMAALHRPALLIADEPNSAVDAINRLEVLSLLERLNRELGTAVLLITHDLISVARICSRVYVLHAGRVVEEGTATAVLTDPAHRFTQALVQAWSGVDRQLDRTSHCREAVQSGSSLPA